MRIALLNTDENSGGAAIACLRLAETLISNGHEVTMFCLNSSGKHSFVKPLAKSFFTRKRAKLNFILERLYFTFFEKNKSVRFAFSPANFGFDITQIYDLKHFDIIHLHWINFGFLSINDLEKLCSINKPIVWTLHDMWAFTGGCHHSGDCLAFTDLCGNCVPYLRKPHENDISHHQVLRKSEICKNIPIAVIGCSQWIAHRARTSSVFKEKMVLSIPNPLDLDIFKPIEVSKMMCGLQNNKKYILIAAMKVSVIWKGFGLLKEALKILHSNFSISERENIEILVAGEANPADFKDIPFKYNLLGRINSMSEMNKVYNLADVFVSSSIQENLPNTIMEAMATGTPCVAFEVGGIPEMIDHKKNGYLASKNDPTELAIGMNWTLKNTNQTMKQDCINHVKSNYDKNVICKSYIAVYESMLNK